MFLRFVLVAATCRLLLSDDALGVWQIQAILRSEPNLKAFSRLDEDRDECSNQVGPLAGPYAERPPFWTCTTKHAHSQRSEVHQSCDAADQLGCKDKYICAWELQLMIQVYMARCTKFCW